MNESDRTVLGCALGYYCITGGVTLERATQALAALDRAANAQRLLEQNEMERYDDNE